MSPYWSCTSVDSIASHLCTSTSVCIVDSNLHTYKFHQNLCCTKITSIFTWLGRKEQYRTLSYVLEIFVKTSFQLQYWRDPLYTLCQTQMQSSAATPCQYRPDGLAISFRRRHGRNHPGDPWHPTYKVAFLETNTRSRHEDLGLIFRFLLHNSEVTVHQLLRNVLARVC